MRFILAFIPFLLLVLFSADPILTGKTFAKSETKTAPCVALSEKTSSVCFTPDSDCTGQIEHLLDSAQKSIHVQAFSFTSSPIAKALNRAQQRGVKVELILDRENAEEQYTPAPDLQRSGVAVWLDGEHQTAHNKIMIVDGETVVTGSFNFTKAAQNKNAENVLVLRDKSLAGLYLKNWEEHRGHSKPYKPSRGAPAHDGQGQSVRR